MADLLLRDLVLSTTGSLAMAAMPPRDGELTMLRTFTASASNVQPGDVYWAVRTDHHDGMCDVEEAFARGAAGAVVSGRPVEPWAGQFAIAVGNVRQALWQSASVARARFGGKVIAVTGQLGKTTTNYLLQNILGEQFSGSNANASLTAANALAGDLAALALLNAHPSHDYLTVEIPSTSLRHFADALRYTCPHYAVVTSAHEVLTHGGLSTILNELPDDGCAILNGDDQLLRRAAAELPEIRARMLWVGRGADNDLVAEQVAVGEHGLSFTMGGIDFRVPVVGRHHLHSILAAIAVGQLFELSLATMAHTLSQFTPPPSRCRIVPLHRGVLLDDSVPGESSATLPTAIFAALDAARELPISGRRVVFCGDFPLPAQGVETTFQQIGRAVVTRCGADLLVACGPKSKQLCAAAVQAGMPQSQAVAFDRTDDAVPYVQSHLGPHDVVLVKNISSEAMRRLADALLPQKLAS